jgi:purine catabolism regulator
VAAGLLKAIDHPAESLLVSVGRPVDSLAGLVSSYRQAAEALRISRVIPPPAGPVTFDSLGALHLLHHLPVEVVAANHYVRLIRSLADHDASNRTELLASLEAYLEAGGVVSEAAHRLHIHRNTLSYRLNRIEELADLDLADPICRLNVHVALKSYQLHMRGGT